MDKVIFSLPQFNKIHETKETAYILDELLDNGFIPVLASENLHKYKSVESINTLQIVEYCRANEVKAVISSYLCEQSANILRELNSQILKVIKVDGGGFLPTYKSPRIGGGIRSYIHWFISPIVNFKKLKYAYDCLEISDLIIIESQVGALNLYKCLNDPTKFRKKIKVCRNPANTKYITSKTNKNARILAIGRFDDGPQKRIDRLIEAYKIYKERVNEPMELAIIGDVPNEYISLNDRNIKFYGKQPPNVVLNEMLNGRVLLSASEWEGFPNIFNEALLHGLSIVSTPYPAAIDAVTGGLTGTVSLKFNGESLADALVFEHHMWESNYRNPEHISELWMNSIKRFSISQIIKEALNNK